MRLAWSTAVVLNVARRESVLSPTLSRRSQAAGFTFIEMMIVFVVLGIMLSIMVKSVRGTWVASSRRSGSREVTAYLFRARTIAKPSVAGMFFSLGLLAMAGTASVIMSTLTGTQSRTIAASVAESRFERVRATPCVSRAGGSAVSRGISEAWTLNRLARADDV